MARECWIFWPAFGCCTHQMLVEIFIFNFFWPAIGCCALQMQLEIYNNEACMWFDAFTKNSDSLTIFHFLLHSLFCQCILPSICPPVRFLFVCLNILMSIYSSVCFSLLPSASLSLLIIPPSVYLSVYPSLCLALRVSFLFFAGTFINDVKEGGGRGSLILIQIHKA